MNAPNVIKRKQKWNLKAILPVTSGGNDSQTFWSASVLKIPYV